MDLKEQIIREYLTRGSGFRKLVYKYGMSKHYFRRYPNLVKGFTPLKAHELWVSNITYVPLKERFAYLFLITDAYSRKIVGSHVSDDIKVSSAVVASQQALAQKPPETIVIHHSDRGIQSIAAMNM